MCFSFNQLYKIACSQLKNYQNDYIVTFNRFAENIKKTFQKTIKINLNRVINNYVRKNNIF